jgi:hypothetical protein
VTAGLRQVLVEAEPHGRSTDDLSSVPCDEERRPDTAWLEVDPTPMSPRAADAGDRRIAVSVL